MSFFTNKIAISRMARQYPLLLQEIRDKGLGILGSLRQYNVARTLLRDQGLSDRNAFPVAIRLMDTGVYSMGWKADQVVEPAKLDEARPRLKEWASEATILSDLPPIHGRNDMPQILQKAFAPTKQITNELALAKGTARALGLGLKRFASDMGFLFFHPLTFFRGYELWRYALERQTATSYHVTAHPEDAQQQFAKLLERSSNEPMSMDQLLDEMIKIFFAQAAPGSAIPDRVATFAYNAQTHAMDLLTSQVLSKVRGRHEMEMRVKLSRDSNGQANYSLPINESALEQFQAQLRRRVFRNTVVLTQDDPANLWAIGKILVERGRNLKRMEKSWRQLPARILRSTNNGKTPFEAARGWNILAASGLVDQAGVGMYNAIKHDWHIDIIQPEYSEARYELFRMIHDGDQPRRILIDSMTRSELFDYLSFRTSVRSKDLTPLLDGEAPWTLRFILLARMATKDFKTHPEEGAIMAPGLSIIARTYKEKITEPTIIRPDFPVDLKRHDWFHVFPESVAFLGPYHWVNFAITNLAGEVTDVVSFDQKSRGHRAMFPQAIQRFTGSLALARYSEIARDRLRVIQALARANKLTKFLREMTAIYGHDLRSPLTFMQLATHIIKRQVGLENKQLTEIVDQFDGSLRRQAHLIDEMIAMSRVDSSEAENLSPSRLDQKDFENLLINYLQFRYEGENGYRKLVREVDSRKFTALVNIPQDIPLVMTNYGLLITFILPLIQNSIRAMEGSRRDKQSYELTIEALPSPQYVTLKITDNGKGISQEDVEKLRKKIQDERMAYASLDPEKQGTGVSISDIAGFIQDMGAVFEIGSDGPEQGAWIRISLPITTEH